MVELLSFRIKNYKSIKDSGICYLDPRITVLAGKNEAGKTSILEALEDFNYNKNVNRDAKPLFDESLVPEIELSLKLNQEDLEKLSQRFGLQIKVSEPIMKITKKYPNVYDISKESLSIFTPDKPYIVKELHRLIPIVKENVTNLPIDENAIDANKHPNIQNYAPHYKEGMAAQDIEKTNKDIEALKLLSKDLNAIIEFEQGFSEFFERTLIPNFILFKTFEDILPNQIPIAQAPQNPLLKDLSSISNLNFDIIQPSTDARKREKHREEINIKFSGDYKQFWSQDDSKLYITWESGILYFWIKEREELYKPEIRSKGRQWHLAFYIRVSAGTLKEKKNVILIDEPGLFLHAKAQKDILKKLEECSDKSQIIFTTHSPYLIERDKLNRIRLVMKDEDGTKVEKITAKADKETLTPILTAIGEDLSSGIRVDKKNSIIVEGYSDYLWLMSFKKLLNIQNELNFIPSVSADSEVYIGSILFGWGLDPIFILDNDRKGNDVKKKLNEKLAIEDKKIICIPEDREGAIENLFSDEDFKKYANYEDSEKSKVLLAIDLYNKIEKNVLKPSDFTEKTKETFNRLFTRLKEVIG